LLFAQYTAGLLPDADEVRPGIWSLPVPYRGSVAFTLCYAFLDESDPKRVHLIDPGGDLPGNREHLVAALESIGLRLDHIASITVTHLHPDHLGLATWLSRLTQVPVIMHALDAADLASGAATSRYSTDIASLGERWGVPSDARERLRLSAPPVTDPPDTETRSITHGDVLSIDSRTVRAIHTPGHTRGHVCFAVEGDDLLLTGDHVLPGIYPPIGRGGLAGTNPIAEYIASLEALVDYDNWEVAPGHGFRFYGLDRRRHDIREHVLRRAGEVARVMSDRRVRTVWELASELTWRGGWDALGAAHVQSALMQTELYVDLVQTAGPWSGDRLHD
jgi:glyoxylase-like metal-dependent hydrolase (beta-lactamase superfamily II)